MFYVYIYIYEHYMSISHILPGNGIHRGICYPEFISNTCTQIHGIKYSNLILAYSYMVSIIPFKYFHRGIWYKVFLIIVHRYMLSNIPIYMVNSISFQTFFVQAFKIGVES